LTPRVAKIIGGEAVFFDGEKIISLVFDGAAQNSCRYLTLNFRPGY